MSHNTPPPPINAIHGNLYHVKLLAHFLIRGITSGYSFKLGREEVGVGKFDDVVFTYKADNKGNNKEHWRYRYLQLKHKYNEFEKITANQLLDEYDKKFGLCDYISSYGRIVHKRVDVHDIIICTNMSFDHSSFKKEGIELLLQEDSENILSFNNLADDKLTKRYKLKMPQEYCYLLKDQAYKKYHWVVSDKLLDSFFNKLVFVVETPSESELDAIRTREIKKYFQLPNANDGDFQSAYVLKEILDWFTNADSPNLTSNKGKDILQKIKFKMESTRVNNISTAYLNNLKKIVEFNEGAVNNMVKELEPLLRDLSNKVVRIISPLPKSTVVKVIPALNAFKEPNSDMALDMADTHLLMPSRYLLDKVETEGWKKSFSLNDSHRFLVILYEGNKPIHDDQYYLKLLPQEQNKKTVILIGSKTNYRKDHSSQFIKDFIHYSDLSDDSKQALLYKTVLFQGYELTVRQVIGDSAPDEIINFPSNFPSMMKELLSRKPLSIPSCAFPYLENSCYINRHFKFPCSLDLETLDKVTEKINSKTAPEEEKCVKVHSKGVEWIGNWGSEEKLKKWEEIDFKLKENANPQSLTLISEGELFRDHSSERQIVVVSGLAGAGKTTLMSQQCHKLKISNPNTWVIWLNLSQHSHAFLQFDDTSMSLSSVTQFFLNHLPAVFNSSPFAGSLLKHRLETSGQIVLFLDGLDEMDGNAQESVFKFLKAVSLTKIEKVYVTTRPHITEMLEKNLFQFAYTLTNFDKADQILYLEEIWQANSNVPLTESVHKFASSLVGRVSETVKDEGKSFVGIPLQCRIIAECFQFDMLETILHTRSADSVLELQESFDVISLYRKFMETKRRVFREEKNNALSSSPTMNYALNFLIKKIENHLTELAINTIVEKEENMRLLWPYLPPYQSLVDQNEEDDAIEKYSLQYGLTCKDEDGNLKFVHKTFAEYLFAKYLFEGFLLKDDEHNRLLENKETMHFIVCQILVDNTYSGVRFFFDAMLKDITHSKEWRKRIDRRIEKLPKRYFDLAISKNARNYRALSTALLNRHKNIFTFLCDCLVGTPGTANKSYARMTLNDTFDDHFWFITQEDYYAQSSDILKKLIHYYNGMKIKEVKTVLIHMMNGSRSRISKMKNTLPDQEERGKNIKIVLDFMQKHRKILKQLDEKKNRNLENYKGEMLEILILNKCYAGLIKQYLKLLSWLYKNKNDSFIQLLNTAINNCSSNKTNNNDEAIEKILYTLRDLGRLNIVHRISCVTLKWNPIAFEHFYQLNLPQDMITESTDIQSLLVQNSAGMTQMHRAAFYGEAEVSQRLLDFRLTPDNRKIAQKIVIDHYMASDDDLLTPLHIAATRGHEIVLRNTLQFLKKVLSDHKLRKDLTSPNGLLYNVMKDALIYRNYTMIQIISKSVKLFLGRGYFIDMLKSQNNYVCRNANLLTIIAEALGDYEFLISLLVKDKNNSEIVRNIEENILLEMLKVKGRDDFVDWLLTANLADGFERIAQLFEKIEIDQLSKIVGTIISTSNGKISYWVKWLNQEFGVDIFGLTEEIFECFQKYVTWISTNLTENTLKDVLIQDNCKATIRVLLLCSEENPVSFALTCLSNDKRKQVGIRIIKNLCPVMRNLFLKPPLSPEKDELCVYWMNVLQLVTDCANKRQLLKFVNTILHEHDLNGNKCSIWGNFFGSGEYIEHMVDKVGTFFKSVSDKLGEDALKDLLLDNSAKTITQALWFYEGLIEVALTHFSDKKKSEIAICIIENVHKNLTQVIAEMFVDEDPYSYPPGICVLPFETNAKSTCFRWFNISQLVVDYADVRTFTEAVQFMQCAEHVGVRSIWEDIFAQKYFPIKFHEKLSAFLQGVSEKLGNDQVKELLLHRHRNVNIIRWAKMLDDNLCNLMLTHLNEENRQQVELLMAFTNATQEDYNRYER